MSYSRVCFYLLSPVTRSPLITVGWMIVSDGIYYSEIWRTRSQTSRLLKYFLAARHYYDLVLVPSHPRDSLQNGDQKRRSTWRCRRPWKLYGVCQGMDPTVHAATFLYGRNINTLYKNQPRELIRDVGVPCVKEASANIDNLTEIGIVIVELGVTCTTDVQLLCYNACSGPERHEFWKSTQDYTRNG